MQTGAPGVGVGAGWGVWAGGLGVRGVLVGGMTIGAHKSYFTVKKKKVTGGDVEPAEDLER